MALITGTMQRYDWGSLDAIARLQGRVPDGRPEAELWFGSHPAGPSKFVDTGQFIEPQPFLVKLLAAVKPLSIQTHPTKTQAIIGFARENTAGVALDAPTRTYRDDNHKPEMIVAITPFEAWCGFRPIEETVALLRAIPSRLLKPFAEVLAGSGDNPLRTVLGLLLTMPAIDQHVLVADVVEACRRNPMKRPETDALLNAEFHFPGDIGCVVTLLLNHLVLAPGEALFLGAGNLHAYARGFGIEVMATSDNVIRGGLTPKHIDVPELLRTVDTAPLFEPRLVPTVIGEPGVEILSFDPPVAEFAIDRIVLEGLPYSWLTEHDEIIVCTDGTVQLSGEHVPPGAASLIPAETVETARGHGTIWRVRQPSRGGELPQRFPRHQSE
jgi:mannose-6-phosphate isomerase